MENSYTYTNTGKKAYVNIDDIDYKLNPVTIENDDLLSINSEYNMADNDRKKYNFKKDTILKVTGVDFTDRKFLLIEYAKRKWNNEFMWGTSYVN